MTIHSNNAILVSSTAGVVRREFCDAKYARSFVDNPDNRGCSAFFCEDGLSAEDVFALSPDFRHRVEEAENKLRSDLRIKAALDKHEVTQTAEVRQAIHRAFTKVCYERLLASLSSTWVDPAPYGMPAPAASVDTARVEAALDDCGVPAEAPLRQSVKKAFQDLLAN